MNVKFTPDNGLISQNKRTIKMFDRCHIRCLGRHWSFL